MTLAASVVLALCLSPAIAQDTNVTATATATSGTTVTATATATGTATSGTSVTTASSTTTGTPASACDRAVRAFVAGRGAACAPANDTCPEQCTELWRSFLEGCVGQNVTLSVELEPIEPPLMFDPVQFAVSYVAGTLVRGRSEDACAEAPLAAVLDLLGFELGCAGATTLLRASGWVCGRNPERTTCSQTCRDILQSPLEACTPQTVVGEGFGEPRLASAEVVGMSQPPLNVRLSDECKEFYEDGVVNWLAAGGNLCDSGYANFSRWTAPDAEVGDVPGCGLRGDACDPACSATWSSVIGACNDHNITLFGYHEPTFSGASVVSLASEFASPLLPGDCREVPLRVGLEIAGENITCADAIMLFGPFGGDTAPCGGRDARECSQTCVDLIAAPLGACRPTDAPELHPLGRPISARSSIYQRAGGLSPACMAVFQPQFDQWLEPPSTTEAAGDMTTGSDAAPATTGTERAVSTAAPASEVADSSSALGLAGSWPAALPPLMLLAAL